MTIAHFEHRSATVAASLKPIFATLSRVAPLRPCEAQNTSQPLFFADAAIDIPISPGCSIPTRCGFMCFLLLIDELLEPCEYGLVPSFAVHRAQHPMTFVRKHQRFRRHSLAPESGEQLQALIQRHTEVLFIGNDKCGCFDIRRGKMRRAPCKMTSCSGAPWWAAGFPIREPEFFTFERHGFQIKDAVVRHGRLESIRVADDPVDGIASVTCACNCRALRIDVRQFRDGIEYGVEIRHDFAAPVLRYLVHEFLAETK